MIIPAIYIVLHLLTITLFFIRKSRSEKYKKPFITAHLVLLLFVVLDIFIINLRGVWIDRIIVVALLLTASMIFALYRRKLNLWQKLYFGFFPFYPIIAAATFLIDRILFVVVAGPLLLTLTIPETKFHSNEYDLREIVGSFAPVQLELVKKRIITEKNLGISNDEQITYKDITGLTIIRVTDDSTIASIKSGEKNYQIVFRR